MADKYPHQLLFRIPLTAGVLSMYMPRWISQIDYEVITGVLLAAAPGYVINNTRHMFEKGAGI